MRPLIQKILSESADKASEVIINAIFKKLKFHFDVRRYGSASEMVGDYGSFMNSYVNLKWGKFFKEIDTEDDETPLFIKIGGSKEATYEWDGVELEMYYEFIEKKIEEGYIEDDVDNEEYIIIDKDFICQFNEFNIKLSVYQTTKNEINVIIKYPRKFDIQIMNILDVYGVEPGEQLYETIKYSLLDRITDKLKSMGVKEKDNMIKFDKK